MSEVAGLEIAVGSKVRVHFHPPGSMKSFSEGMVRRVDVTTQEGRFFVVEVTHEVILDREHRIRPGFQDFVRYEDRNDFPGRVEILPTAEKVPGEDATVLSGELPEEPKIEVAEQLAAEVNVQSEPESGRMPEAESISEPVSADVEPQPVRKQGGLLSALFGRRR